MSHGGAVENCLAARTPRFASAGRAKASAPTQTKAPTLESGGYNIVWDLEEYLQAQLHVESFSGPDAGGSVEIADGVGDRSAAWTCGA